MTASCTDDSKYRDTADTGEIEAEKSTSMGFTAQDDPHCDETAQEPGENASTGGSAFQSAISSHQESAHPGEDDPDRRKSVPESEDQESSSGASPDEVSLQGLEEALEEIQVVETGPPERDDVCNTTVADKLRCFESILHKRSTETRLFVSSSGCEGIGPESALQRLERDNSGKMSRGPVPEDQSEPQPGPENGATDAHPLGARLDAVLRLEEKPEEDLYEVDEDLVKFYEAVRSGDSETVETLTRTSRRVLENLDEPDWNVSGDPPLLIAATNQSFEVLSILLAKKCDPGVRSPRGETALHRAILNGGPGNVRRFVVELLNHGCPSSVKEAGGGLTALHILTRQLAHYSQASRNLHQDFDEAVKTLEVLAKAGPVNAKDHQGRSALHILASSTIFDNNREPEIQSLIETLLDAGADSALKNDRGETALHECLECGALNTALVLMPRTPVGIVSRYGETPLHIASRKNYREMVGKLLERGEDPSVQDAGGNTPLHLASARGFHQTVSLLVTSPLAQLEKLNDEGLTALQVATESGFLNAVRLLLKAGADPSKTAHLCTSTLQHRRPDISILIDHEITRRRQLAA